MRYAPPGLCLNDFAVIERPDGAYELLHLQGPWTPRFVHFDMETSYGRAESTDLLDWTPLGPGFGLGAPGAFDGTAVWTMHPFRHGEGSVMFYTGFSDTPFPRQTIGMARSARHDGTGWRRVGDQPVVVADERWYRTQEGMGWRDPFVVWAPEVQAWVMVVCASDASLPLEVSGAVAWATSKDLLTWEVQPPLISPGDVNELECPVLERTATGWLLLGCLGGEHAVGTWTAETITGPWRRGTQPWPAGAYAPRLVTGPDGSRLVLHTVPRRVGLRDDGERCRGMLAQPKLLVLEPSGDTHLAWWHGLDAHFAPEGAEVTRGATGAGAVDADPAVGAGPDLVELDVEARFADVPGTASSVRFRAARSTPAASAALAAPDRSEPLPELSLLDGRVSFGVPGEAPLDSVALPATVTTLRVLTVGEYVEVYADGRLVMSTLSYRGTPARIDAVVDGAVVAVVNHVRARRSPRDDASAVWSGR